jgi:hypothetical protein
MAATLKYNLQQINDIVSNGLVWEIPEDTLQIINYLCSEVGSASISSNIYERKEPLNSFSSDNGRGKKKRGNKNMEVTDEEWETLRTFQATKIEQKIGIGLEIDQLRSLLNKLTDKTFLDIREKIIDKINAIVSSEDFTLEDSEKVSTTIYDIASANKFYSKIFADLYAELVSNYIWLRPHFDTKYESLFLQFNTIEYVDPDVNYDKFCDINKANEKRRAVTTFYLNLAKNGFIPKEFIVNLTKNLIQLVLDYIEKPNKKNEVDELTENIAILFNKDFIEEFLESDDVDAEQYELDTNDTIIEAVSNLAKMKAKDYPSLSNKAIFKYMDMVEM